MEIGKISSVQETSFGSNGSQKTEAQESKKPVFNNKALIYSLAGLAAVGAVALGGGVLFQKTKWFQYVAVKYAKMVEKASQKVLSQFKKANEGAEKLVESAKKAFNGTVEGFNDAIGKATEQGAEVTIGGKKFTAKLVDMPSTAKAGIKDGKVKQEAQKAIQGVVFTPVEKANDAFSVMVGKDGKLFTVKKGSTKLHLDDDKLTGIFEGYKSDGKGKKSAKTFYDLTDFFGCSAQKGYIKTPEAEGCKKQFTFLNNTNDKGAEELTPYKYVKCKNPLKNEEKGNVISSVIFDKASEDPGVLVQMHKNTAIIDAKNGELGKVSKLLIGDRKFERGEKGLKLVEK